MRVSSPRSVTLRRVFGYTAGFMLVGIFLASMTVLVLVALGIANVEPTKPSTAEESSEPAALIVNDLPQHMEILPPPDLSEVDYSDLDTREGEGWRPRDFNYRARCENADVDSRLPPAIWWEEFEDTRDKVLGRAIGLPGEPELEDIQSHTEFWEDWCPPSGQQWEDAHSILLVGLYYIEDAHYFAARHEETGDSIYRTRSREANQQGWRYIEEGIRDAIPWYGDMPVFDEGDPRVEVCLAGGLPDTYWMPLCDYYDGPVRDPNSTHYNPNHPTVSEWIQSEREWEQQQKGS